MSGKCLTAVSLLLRVLLPGCASKGHWYKPDMTSFDRDALECRTSARYTSIVYFPNNQPPQVLEGFDQGIFDRCMKIRGYAWVKEVEGRSANEIIMG